MPLTRWIPLQFCVALGLSLLIACGGSSQKTNPKVNAPPPPKASNVGKGGTISSGRETDGLSPTAPKLQWRTSQETYLVKGGVGNSIIAAENRSENREHEFQRRIKIGKILPLPAGLLCEGTQKVSVTLQDGRVVDFIRAMTVLEGEYRGETGRIRADHLKPTAGGNQ